MIKTFPIFHLFQLKDDLFEFLAEVKKSYADFSVAFSRIQSALAKMDRQFPGGWQFDLMPWTEVIHAVIDYRCVR